MSILNFRSSILVGTLACVVLVLVAACSEDTPVQPAQGGFASLGVDAADALLTDRQNGEIPPGEIVEVQVGTEALRFWPYTGSSFDGVGVDPINLVFIGRAGPLQIREALLSLDGDRSAYGIPPVPPFDQPWIDIVGGAVQTTYSEGGMGWSGSVIQLTLGQFGPMRVHVRLFSTGRDFDDGGVWTLGAAHFELQIPNTTEHEVLSWELAEQIVLVDMMRSGLLDDTVPLFPSGPINAAPSWRAIQAAVYNFLPDELIDLIGGPPKPVGDDVPLPSDGQATVFQLVDALPISPGQWMQSAQVEFDQLVPRPFCAEGPGDFIQISGPVDFITSVQIDEEGRYTYASDYTGDLLGIPMDVSTGVPVPVGDPIVARVDGKQQGFMDVHGERISARDNRMAFGADGPERILTHLRVASTGRNGYQLLLRCFAADE